MSYLPVRVVLPFYANTLMRRCGPGGSKEENEKVQQ